MPAISEETLAGWDGWMRLFWASEMRVGLGTAEQFYEEEEEPFRPEVIQNLATEFLQVLRADTPQLPATPVARYEAVVKAIERVLHRVRTTPAEPFIEEKLAVALRPVRKLQLGALTPEVCAVLYDFHRGIWTVHLTKPQRWTIRIALMQTLAALPAEAMTVFWENLDGSQPMLSEAMGVGLELLTTAHAVPQLLHGLEQSHNHDNRTLIVNCLEQIADARALETLHRLRRETAHTDWTLSRQIARTIRVIEQQNRDQNSRTLLRPTQAPEHPDSTLLRPATDTAQTIAQRQETTNPTLLRPVGEEKRD